MSTMVGMGAKKDLPEVETLKNKITVLEKENKQLKEKISEFEKKAK